MPAWTGSLSLLLRAWAHSLVCKKEHNGIVHHGVVLKLRLDDLSTRLTLTVATLYLIYDTYEMSEGGTKQGGKVLRRFKKYSKIEKNI